MVSVCANDNKKVLQCHRKACTLLYKNDASRFNHSKINMPFYQNHILQVKKEGDTGGVDAGGQATNTQQDNLKPLQLDTDNHVNNSTEKPPKKKNKLFHSLLCCFGKRYRSNRPKSIAGDGGGGGSLPGGAGDGGSPSLGEEKPLLGELRPEDADKKCLVIDLDETLVHSSFKPINNADFIVPVEIDGIIHQVCWRTCSYFQRILTLYAKKKL